MIDWAPDERPAERPLHWLTSALTQHEYAVLEAVKTAILHEQPWITLPIGDAALIAEDLKTVIMLIGEANAVPPAKVPMWRGRRRVIPRG